MAIYILRHFFVILLFFLAVVNGCSSLNVKMPSCDLVGLKAVKLLSPSDQCQIQKALENFGDHHPHTWDTTNYHCTMRLIKTYSVNNGIKFCREYSLEILHKPHNKKIFQVTIACRKSDGQWEDIN